MRHYRNWTTVATNARWRHFVVRLGTICAAVLGCVVLQHCDQKPPDACSYLAKAIDAGSGGPVFLASYPTTPAGPLHDTAFLYDNALATIALVGCGEQQKAARIGDAILFALDHDRYWRDGRLRNAYLAGPVGRGSIKLAGWWNKTQNQWAEDRYQVASDSGNMAWAILALLSLEQATGDRQYLDGARRIGNWVARWRTKRGPGGFTGGTFAHEPTPQIALWKSTEHNADLAAAFLGLAKVTGDRQWLVQARSAQGFVQAMWSPACRCFMAGTGEDGTTPNPLLALDSQVVPLLAIPGAMNEYGAARMTVEKKLSDDGGFSYSEAKDGLWTEGTAQFALLAELSGREREASTLMNVLDRLRSADGSYFAANTRELSTGLVLDTDASQTRQYFHIPHLAATSWVAMAAHKQNPFTQTDRLPWSLRPQYPVLRPIPAAD